MAFVIPARTQGEYMGWGRFAKSDIEMGRRRERTTLLSRLPD